MLLVKICIKRGLVEGFSMCKFSRTYTYFVTQDPGQLVIPVILFLVPLDFWCR